jgi:hypothetical protein
MTYKAYVKAPPNVIQSSSPLDKELENSVLGDGLFYIFKNKFSLLTKIIYSTNFLVFALLS